MDFGPFPLGAGGNRRVRFLQPQPHFLGVLIARVAAWPLGREAPARQIAADGALRQFQVVFLADQVADGTAGPQRRRDAEVLGLMAAQEALKVFGLDVGEHATRAHRASTPAFWERGHAVVGVSGPPAANGLARDAEDGGDFDFGETQLATAQGTQAQRFEDVIG